MTSQTRRLYIPEAHPTAALHFPGLPVVPAALLLAEVAALIAGVVPLRFQAVKFIAPVRYGEALELAWRMEGRLASFRVLRSAEAVPVMAGTLEILA